MTAFDSLGALPGQARDGVVHLLYRMADDELLIGHQDLEWTGHLPLIDAGDAVRSMVRENSLWINSRESKSRLRVKTLSR